MSPEYSLENTSVLADILREALRNAGIPLKEGASDQEIVERFGQIPTNNKALGLLPSQVSNVINHQYPAAEFPSLPPDIEALFNRAWDAMEEVSGKTLEE